MAALPKTLTFTAGGLNFRVIHGGVDIINRFVFASQRDVLAEETMRADADVVIGGHAGVPFIEKIGRGVWFNPGVIGVPANDGTPDVWYGLVRQPGRPHRALHPPARLRSSRRRRCHAPLRPRHGYARTLVTGLRPSLDVFPPAERAATGQKLRPRTLRIPASAAAQAAE